MNAGTDNAMGDGRWRMGGLGLLLVVCSSRRLEYTVEHCTVLYEYE